jgi:aldehyde dehydrogenase (NAD+)
MDIREIVIRQQEYFRTGETLPVAFRIARLKDLAKAIVNRREQIEAALVADLGKHPFETHLTETGLVLAEIRHALRHLRQWARPKRRKTPLVLFAATSKIHRDPYGVVLIMAPWNYPLQLALDPLVGAIAGGNCAVVKPGSYAPATAKAIADLISATFDPAYVTTVLGGRVENATLLDQEFDYIFFTGGTEVGKTVMAKAAERLIPVTLELGGKSPCIIDSGCDLELASRRIAFGKIINAGQTCVAPDYVMLPAADRDAFVASFRAAVMAFLGPDPLTNPEYPKIVNAKHHARLLGLMTSGTVAFGGAHDETRIAPTLLVDVRPEDPVMQEEIFGPLLPILTYDVIDEAIAFVEKRDHPLALYLFTKDRRLEKRIVETLRFGGATINDTLMHFASTEVGAGGVGASGMGNYHGIRSFETFTHEKAVVRRARWLDLDLRYHPYTKVKEWIARRLLK